MQNYILIHLPVLIKLFINSVKCEVTSQELSYMLYAQETSLFVDNVSIEFIITVFITISFIIHKITDCDKLYADFRRQQNSETTIIGYTK